MESANTQAKTGVNEPEEWQPIQSSGSDLRDPVN